ncbi:MAG: prolyl oligopeptidase family serine peptidase [Opitutaceae bacterium]|nr:prolyl oligopeptidase family serine peptidase [Opitutaceae bacterium]
MCVCVAGLLRAASFDDRVESLLRPPMAAMIALSPEGQRIAYTTQGGRHLRIVIMDLDHPGPKRSLIVDPDRGAASPPAQSPAQLRFLRWATAGRLVFAPTPRVVPLLPVTDQTGRLVPNPDGPTIVSPIMVMDADGKQRGTLVDARDFMETSADAVRTLGDLLRTPKELAATRKEPVRWRMPHLDILGFVPGKRDQLIIETRGGYSIPMQHSIDIRTGSVSMFGGNWPSPPGEPQVFDWYRLKVVGERKDAVRPTTAWRDDELGRVQRELELKFPRRVVEILDWSETRARVLFRVTGGSDPGRIFVFQRPEDLALEILRRAPWLNASKLNDTRFFEFDAPDGARLSGYLTWPKKTRRHPPPLLVVFPSGFPGRAQPAFDPEAQVFADLGFVVARLNHRGVAGVRAEDLTALRTAVDRVSVDDVRVAIEWLAQRFGDRPFDRKRVAALGRGFGGYLAVRALQLQPDVFRGAIAIDAPMDLRPWLQPRQTTGRSAPGAMAVRDIPAALIDHERADWKNLSVLDQAEALTNPVLLLVESTRSPAIDVSTAELRAKLHAFGRMPDYIELDPGFTAARPASRAAVYRRIEEFLNLHLDNSAVKIGPAKEVE